MLSPITFNWHFADVWAQWGIDTFHGLPVALQWLLSSLLAAVAGIAAFAFRHFGKLSWEKFRSSQEAPKTRKSIVQKRKPKAPIETALFPGRTWVFSEIKNTALQKKVVLLLGPTGVGKTEIIRSFSDDAKDTILVTHYCEYDSADSKKAKIFLQHLYASAYPQLKRGRRDDASLRSLLADNPAIARGDEILTAFFSAIPQDRRTWIVVDALDEAIGTGASKANNDSATDDEAVPSVLKLLLDKISTWPPAFRLLISGRAYEQIVNELNLKTLEEYISIISLEMPSASDLDFDRSHVVKDAKGFIDFLWDSSKEIMSPGALEKRESLTRKMVQASGGNFLLARFNFEDYLKHPEPYEKSNTPFAKSLADRYLSTFKRLFSPGNGPIKYRTYVAPILEIVVATEDTEPLTTVSILEVANVKDEHQVFIRPNGIEIRPKDLESVLKALESFLSRSKAGGLKTFHKSFSDWLVGNDDLRQAGTANEYLIAKESGNRLLTPYCVNTLKIVAPRKKDAPFKIKNAASRNSSERFSYLRNFGVHHFIDQRQFADAVHYAQFLIAQNDHSSPTPNHLGRIALLGLRACVNDRKASEEIDAQCLSDLLDRVYQTDPLKAGLKILIWYHATSFFLSSATKPSIRSELLEKGSYVVCFEMASILAEACVGNEHPFYKYENIIEDIESADASIRELGCYALARYCSNVSLINDRELNDLKRLDIGETFTTRQVLGEALLNASLTGALPAKDILALLPDEDNMLWQHNIINRNDVRAALNIRGDSGDQETAAKLKPADTVEELAFDHMANVEALRIRAWETYDNDKYKFRILFDEKVFYSLGADEEPIEIADESIRKALTDWDKGKLIIETLFSHPLWNVGERTASTLSKAIEGLRGDQRQSLIENIKEFWTPQNRQKKEGYYWKVQLAAIETAFISFNFEPNFFEESVRKFYDDPCCRIRGLCIEDLSRIILDLDKSEWNEQFNRFGALFDRWLADPDCWVLDHVYRLLSRLDKENVDWKKFRKAPTSGLLTGKSLAKWGSMPRADFLREIQVRQKIIYDEAQKRRPKPHGNATDRSNISHHHH